MKNFVVKYGSIVVNIIALFTFIGIVISGITVMVNQGIWAGLLSLWAGITGFIAVFFLIYLVMSINDRLGHISSNPESRFT